MADEFPMRINRYLAHEGYATRREADTLIEKGLVTVNGERATLGMKVEKMDKVVVDEGVLKRQAMRYRYVAYHKPVGVSTDPQKEGESIKTSVPALKGLFPIGRLDKESHGLVILTNDGRLTDRLLNPNYEHEKEYAVKIDKTVTDAAIRRMERGVFIEGYKTRPARARRRGETVFTIVLTEGKKHQIRRMCAALGYKVLELTRTRVMNIKLDNLKGGGCRDITGEELLKLKKSIGL